MSLLGEWRAARERRLRAATYLQTLLPAADAADLQWLAGLAGNPDAAQRELAFARRALALIAAERDALDDRTASDVARELLAVTESESRRDPQAAALWVVRWRGYTEALAVRGVTETPPTRLARVLLSGVGVEAPSVEQLARAAQCIQSVRARANEALRAVFGVASLPDDVRPSAIRS